MVRAIGQIRAVCAVLVLGMVMALGVVALSEAAPFGGYNEPAVHQMVEADSACADAACTERNADDCSAAQACCGACAVLALETAGVPARPGDAWGLIPRPMLSGLAPLVNRHPPRVHA
ncbi:hypothetical protein [Mesorhizobium sp. KR9-304]|uniref:hypothetical protein n=1 Tax=Mesorhizobium sp. KR9-304 TaxID=3156614 RepID=UPI0032B614AD